LKLNCGEPLSHVGFSFKLRRYCEAGDAAYADFWKRSYPADWTISFDGADDTDDVLGSGSSGGGGGDGAVGGGGGVDDTDDSNDTNGTNDTDDTGAAEKDYKHDYDEGGGGEVGAGAGEEAESGASTDGEGREGGEFGEEEDAGKEQMLRAADDVVVRESATAAGVTLDRWLRQGLSPKYFLPSWHVSVFEVLSGITQVASGTNIRGELQTTQAGKRYSYKALGCENITVPTPASR
jgi:hypothetical protein